MWRSWELEWRLRKVQGSLESEFELLSLKAFSERGIRHSNHGIYFDHWLPVALSARHYKTMKEDLTRHLTVLRRSANLEVRTPAEFIYHFMNDVIVELSQVPGRLSDTPQRKPSSRTTRCSISFSAWPLKTSPS